MVLPAIGSIDRQADLQIQTEIEDKRKDRGGVGPWIFLDIYISSRRMTPLRGAKRLTV